MLYTVTGFPFDLLWGLLIALIYKPKINIFIVAIVTCLLLIPGFFIPEPFYVLYWVPGGASTVVIATSLVTYSLVENLWTRGLKLDAIPNRRVLRGELLKIDSVEERQQEYINIVQRVSIIFEKNNESILKRNTSFFLISFFSLFLVNFTAIAIIHQKNPELIKNIFLQFYQSVQLDPGTFENWFSSLAELGALHIFVADILFFLIILSVIGRILAYRKIRQPVIGCPAYFHLPTPVLWLYILSGAVFFFVIKMQYGGLLLFASKNLFFILSVIYIFQGISIFWLYLQVRLLPAGGVVTTLIILGFLTQLLTLIVFSVFLVIGLLDFWIDLRKKALHPRLFSDGV